jgi:hypothetical protein
VNPFRPVRYFDPARRNARVERRRSMRDNRQPLVKCESELDQSKGQLTLILVLVPLHEIRDRSGQSSHLQIAAAT